MTVLAKTRRNFLPHLINLESYRRELEWCMKKVKTPRPVPSIPGSPYVGGWTTEELKAMKENRKTAKLIYNAVIYGTK